MTKGILISAAVGFVLYYITGSQSGSLSDAFYEYFRYPLLIFVGFLLWISRENKKNDKSPVDS